MTYAKWALAVWMLCAPALHALDVSYSSFLKFTDISSTGGKVVLPVERKKYRNIRVLDKATYQFVAACQTDCVQPATQVAVEVLDVRPAQTRPDMWIVSVAFNQAWAVTFLVFRRGDTYNVKSPAHFEFLQDALKQQTQTAIVAAVQQDAV